MRFIQKQHYVEMGILCDLTPSTVTECNATVLITNPRSGQIWYNLDADYKQNS